MSLKNLSGKKIAIVVESQYIPLEIKTYQEEFRNRGAEVHLISRLWGKEKLTFVSEVEKAGQTPKTLDVSIDFSQVDVDDYAAIIMAANFSAVRLLWVDDKDISGEQLNSDSGRKAPAVQFFYKAMIKPNIVKGFPCHGLYILSPIPETLVGRKVTCNRVMLSIAKLEGASYTVPERTVEVDADIVTSNSSSDDKILLEFVESICDQILAVEKGEATPSPQSSIDKIVEKILKSLKARLETAAENFDPANRPIAIAAKKILDGSINIPAEIKRLTNVDFDNEVDKVRKPILIVCSKFGTWASELTIVAGVLQKAGYDVKVATEDGTPPHFLSPSLDPSFEDGAWRYSVVSGAERDLALQFLKPGTREHRLLEKDNIINIGQLPKPPQVGDYIKNPSLLIDYKESLKNALQVACDFDAIVITGGSGAIPGLMADRGLHSLILAFNELGKPIMGECNGGLAIAQTLNPETDKSILGGRAVTTHSWLDEYQSGWGWVSDFQKDPDIFWKDEQFDFKEYAAAEVWHAPGTSGNPLIDSAAMFNNAAGIGGLFFSPPGTPYSVVVDGNLITCRTTPDGYPGVIALLAILNGKPPLTGRFFIDQDQMGRISP